MLRLEMIETTHYWSNRVNVIETELIALENEQDAYQCGLKSLLHRLKWCAEHQHYQAMGMFSKLIDIPSTGDSPSCSRLLTIDLNDVDSDTESDSDSSDSEFF